MGETEEERDNVGKLFENFVQASTCKGTLQAFNVLCRQLDLNPTDNSNFYSSLKAKVTSWKAKALWSKLDKRICHKEYKKGQACVGSNVSLRISLYSCSLYHKKFTSHRHIEMLMMDLQRIERKIYLNRSTFINDFTYFAQ